MGGDWVVARMVTRSTSPKNGSRLAIGRTRCRAFPPAARQLFRRRLLPSAPQPQPGRSCVGSRGGTPADPRGANYPRSLRRSGPSALSPSATIESALHLVWERLLGDAVDELEHRSGENMVGPKVNASDERHHCYPDKKSGYNHADATSGQSVIEYHVVGTAPIRQARSGPKRPHFGRNRPQIAQPNGCGRLRRQTGVTPGRST